MIFPPYGEYDVTTFDYGDPHEWFYQDNNRKFRHPMVGKPYGGYARATASRLAKLPLRFTGDVGFDLVVQEEGYEQTCENVSGEEVGTCSEGGGGTPTHYFEMRDYQGRMFVCRVYNETDLLSLKDAGSSVFDVVQEKGGGNDVLDDYDGVVGAKDEVVTSDLDENNVESHANMDEDDILEWYIGSLPDALNFVNKNGKIVESDFEDEEIPIPIMSALQEIIDGLNSVSYEDLCSMTSPDWWSYKFCFREKLNQYHNDFRVDGEVKKGDDDISDGRIIFNKSEDYLVKRGDKLVEAVQRTIDISLGTFESEEFLINESLLEGSADINSIWNSFYLKQKYTSGDTCKLTGKAREATVNLKCCERSNRHNSLFRLGAMMEIPKDSCKYEVSACTPLMCAKRFMEPHIEPIVKKLQENISVRNILQRALKTNCLIRAVDWWKYEFCYMDKTRQFHAVSLETDMEAKKATMVCKLIIMLIFQCTHLIFRNHRKVIDKQYYLGSFVVGSDIDENEEDHIINVADLQSDKSNFVEGNGAIFVEEYIGGTSCGGKDVDDSVIEGNVGAAGIARSSTIRYFCGKRLELTDVTEDRTCHYIVDVSVPDLCQHPLFQISEESHGQVVKCLPIPGQ